VIDFQLSEKPLTQGDSRQQDNRSSGRVAAPRRRRGGPDRGMSRHSCGNGADEIEKTEREGRDDS